MDESNKPSLLRLFLVFAKMGAITFGGGYAMLPILQREVVEHYRWCDESDLLDYFAVGQCTPGIIAVNTATFIGYKTRGVMGGIIATLGLVFPSLVIISVIYNILDAFKESEHVKMALSGIQVAVCALIFTSVVKLAKKSIVDAFTLSIAIATLALMLLLGISPVVFVLVSIALGIGFSLLKARKGGQR